MALARPSTVLPKSGRFAPKISCGKPLHQATEIWYNFSQHTLVSLWASAYAQISGVFFLPLWMAAEVMTFGNMLTLFRMLKKRDKKAIAKDFDVNADTFETWLKSLNFVRNVCAHHGRLWNRHLAIAPGIPVKDPRWHEKRYPIVPHRIYSVLCILKQLIDVIAPQSRWSARFIGVLAEFPDVHRISMAMPTGFEKSLIWRTPSSVWTKVRVP